MSIVSVVQNEKLLEIFCSIMCMYLHNTVLYTHRLVTKIDFICIFSYIVKNTRRNAFCSSLKLCAINLLCFRGGSEVKNPLVNAGDTGSIPWSGRSAGEENGDLVRYPCLRNLRDRGAWWATVHGATKSQTQLRDFQLKD